MVRWSARCGVAFVRKQPDQHQPDRILMHAVDADSSSFERGAGTTGSRQSSTVDGIIDDDEVMEAQGEGLTAAQVRIEGTWRPTDDEARDSSSRELFAAVATSMLVVDLEPPHGGRAPSVIEPRCSEIRVDGHHDLA